MAGMEPSSLAVETSQETTVTEHGGSDLYVLRSPSAVDDETFSYDSVFPEIEPDVNVKLSILMAAYNEESTIRRAVLGILRTPYPCEIELIVIDDGSTDRTSRVVASIRDSRLIFHRHVINQGKGASILTAASLATGTHIVPFDADMEYDPSDLGKMLLPVLAGRCDVVYGTRLFGFNTVYHSYRYAIGNKLLTALTNILYNSYISDMHTCLKLMPLQMMRSMRLDEKRFGLDTELTAMLLRSGRRPFEVPVSYYSRSHEQGKKIGWRDGVKCIWILCKVRVRPRGRRTSVPRPQLAMVEDTALSAGAGEP